jgi:O-succinylbenzoic acid--CoA ligase
VLIPLVNDEGWFATRDRGEMYHGNLRVIGRFDNLFFSGGEGIQPEEVERVIARHPAVTQVFIVPVDDIEFGQRPVAVVDAESPLNFSELSAWVKDKLAGFQQPCRWLLLPEKMKGTGIKVSRHQLALWVNAHKTL